MKPIPVMLNGLPGNMAAAIARHLLADDRFRLIPQSLTGPEITEKQCTVDGHTIDLITPERREPAVEAIKSGEDPFISVDFTHPSAVNSNGSFYCRSNLPFVMGTTGGNREQLHDAVAASDIPAVIAPNMAKQIVGFQALMAYGAHAFPNLFSGYSLAVRESHQRGKADTSGTAKAMVTYFNDMGIPFSADEIDKERDPEVQKKEWGIPGDHLKGHAWHTYSLASDDGTATFAFTHNINGRDIYAKGTLDAIVYLDGKVREHIRGKVFTMIDLLRGD